MNAVFWHLKESKGPRASLLVETELLGTENGLLSMVFIVLLVRAPLRADVHLIPVRAGWGSRSRCRDQRQVTGQCSVTTNSEIPDCRAPLGPIRLGGLNILSSYGLVQQVGVRKPRRLKAG